MEIRRYSFIYFIIYRIFLLIKKAAILEKLDEIVAILAKKFCDKNETKKALMYIENRVI